MLLILFLSLLTQLHSLNVGWFSIDSLRITGNYEGCADHIAVSVNNSIYVYSGSNFQTSYVDITIDYYKNLYLPVFTLNHNGSKVSGSVKNDSYINYVTTSLSDVLQLSAIKTFSSSFLTGNIDYSLLGDLYLTGTPPLIPRTGSAMTYNPYSGEYLLFGGYNNAHVTLLPTSDIRRTSLNDLWAYNTASKAWRQVHTFDIIGVSKPTPMRPSGTGWHSFITVKYNNTYYGLLANGVGDYSLKLDSSLATMWFLDLTPSKLTTTSSTYVWFNVTYLYDSNPPIGVDGGKLVGDDTYTYAYRFGGYSCTTSSLSTKGGSNCYLQSFYRLTQSTMKWNQIAVTTSTPSNRAYHSSLFYNKRFYVIGGCYQSDTGGWTYLNDVNAYDTLSSKWISIYTVGSPMSGRRSHSSSIINNIIYNYGGWSDQEVFSDITGIMHDATILPSNFYATGSISNVTSGQVNSISIQIRASTLLVNGSNAISSYSWGDNLIWGNNLDFSISLVGYSNYDSSIVYKQYSKKDTNNFIDNGNSTYIIYYTLESGSYYTMSITYSVNDVATDIPGSPFIITVMPASVDFSKLLVFGGGIVQAVKTQSTQFYVMFRDVYYNPIPATSALMSRLSFNLTTESSITTLTSSNTAVASGDWDVSVFSTYTTNKLSTPPVSIALIQYIQPEISQYMLSIAYDMHILSQRYSVATYSSVEVSSSLENGAFGFLIFVLVVVLICFLFLIIFWEHSVIRASSQNYLICIIFGAIVSIAGIWIRIYVESLTDAICTETLWLIDIGFLLYAVPIFMKSHFVSKIEPTYNGFVLVDNFGLFVPLLCLFTIECIISAVQYSYYPQRVMLYSLPKQSYLTYHDCGSSSYIFEALLYGYKAIILICGSYFALSTVKSDIMFFEGPLIATASFHMAFVYFIALPLILFISTPSIIYGLEIFTILWVVLVTTLLTFVPKMYYILFGEVFEFDGNDIYDVNLPTGTMGVTQAGASQASVLDINETKDKAAKGLRDDIGTADDELVALKDFIQKHNALIEKLEIDNVKLKSSTGINLPNVGESKRNSVSKKDIVIELADVYSPKNDSTELPAAQK